MRWHSLLYLYFSVVALVAMPRFVQAGEPGATVSYRHLAPQDLPRYGLAAATSRPRQTGRKLPRLVTDGDLHAARLRQLAVDLRHADTRSAVHFFERKFGSLQSNGGEQLFNPQAILLKFHNDTPVRVLRVAPLSELRALAALRKRADVEFAELDFFQQRQFVPNDTLLSNQWHHAVIDSYTAWSYSLGTQSVRIAIVDTPFQMNHPDLAAHTESGWDVVDETTISAHSGINHSTLGAGLAAAVIGNGIGIAGAANCRVLPININGALSEMGQATYWAADHGVRIVNISWTGAYSETLNTAGHYLKTNTQGLLFMAGVNFPQAITYSNHPHIYCVSMTDAAENMRSWAGDHIDFAAPGFAMYSTAINGAYGTDSGTSFSTPLFSGIAAMLMSINPILGPDAIIDLLKNTARDLGPAGWDRFFGWGRVDFAAAAAATWSTLPRITSIHITNNEAQITIPFEPNRTYELWQTTQLESPQWQLVPNPTCSTNASTLTLRTPTTPSSKTFYRARITRP